jgi:hypothetical protein
MSILELLQANLLSPVVLCFVLGVLAALVKSDLELPDAFVTALSIYLLLAIGLKGGVELSKASMGQLIGPVLATLLAGVAVPVWTYAIVRWLGRFDVDNAAAMAAHYGSCSVVTFITAVAYLQSQKQPVEGFLPALVAILEVPAIVVALLIARVGAQRIAAKARANGDTEDEGARPAGTLGQAIHEVLAGRSVLLLIGGLLIGYAAGEKQFEPVKLLFADAFRGILCLFLLELGIKAAGHFRDLKRVGVFLPIFAIAMPVFNGFVGVVLGEACGLSVGGATAFGVLVASSSYIAAPAAVRIALPRASPAYYLTASLAITFPFNLALGIPLYYTIAQRICG